MSANVSDSAVVPRIGIFGGGAIGSAFVRGMLKSGLVKDPHSIIVAEPIEFLAEKLKKETGCRVTDSAQECAQEADVLFVCVKPETVTGLAKDILPSLDAKRHLIISVAAGIPTQALSLLFAPLPIRIIRCMPNTACLVGESASTLYANELVTELDLKLATGILDALGMAVRVSDEDQINAATGMAGSGIAFVYLMIESMADGGVRCGLPRREAQRLAAQTVLGAAKMVLADGAEHPGALKDMVCSPSGTTIEGVAALERNKFRSTVLEAVTAAAHTSRELAAVAQQEQRKMQMPAATQQQRQVTMRVARRRRALPPLLLPSRRAARLGSRQVYACISGQS